MFKKTFLIFIFIQIILNQEIEIQISDTKDESRLISNKMELYKITYSGLKNYIQVKVQSTTTNPYIIFCQKQDCKMENAYLISNLREKEQSLYINRKFLNENKGYIQIYSYEESLEGKIFFSVSDMMILERDKSISFYSPINKDENIIKIDRKNEKSFMTLSVYVPNQQIEKIIFYYNNGNEEKELSNVIDTHNGKVINLKEDDLDYNENSYYKIVILSNSNAYIVINSKVFKDDISNFNLNSLVYQGLINNILMKQCFKINIDNINDETININLKLLKGVISYNFDDKKMIPLEKNDIEIIKKKSELKTYKMCLESYNTDTVYILEIIDLNDQRNNINFYSPQINGIIYSRKTPKNKLVYFNFAKKGNEDLNKITFYLQFKKGHPIMYQINCNSYPKCIYDTNNINEYIESKIFNETQLLNNIYFYSFETNNTNFINSNQNLLGVYCKGNDDCEYETLIFGKDDEIYLKSDQRLSFHLQNGFTHKYKIEISNPQVHTIIFNVITFSGDNIIDVIDYDYMKFKLQKNVFINKQEFIFIKIDNNTDLVNKFLFSIKSKNNSFYSVEYEEFSSEKIDYIKSGLIYIESIELNEKRTLFITRSRLENDNINFYASFFALNCKITIYKSDIENPILTNDYFVKDEIFNNKDKFINYTIKVDKMDNLWASKYEQCMIYISSIENDYNEKDKMEQRSILISENIEQKVTLTNKIKGIKYIYPFTINKEGNIVFIFTLIGQPPIKISVFSNNNIIELNHKISSSRNYILENNRIKCENKNELCQIIIDITGEEKDLENNISFSFIIKSDDDVPQYIKKGLMICDVISGKSINYYYTEVNQNEEGEIIVNFERGKGNIYGRIVNKDIEKENNANWMGRFHFPNKNDEGLLIYNEYSNKIEYYFFKTSLCNHGCYLLLSIENSVISLLESPSFLYQISIISKVVSYEKKQITEIQLDRFIINTFPITEVDLINYYHYYTFTLPYNAEKILLELQSDMTILYVNYGNKLPTHKYHNIIFNANDIHSVFEITNNLNIGSKFTIGVGYNRNFSYSNDHIYSLRVRAIKKNIIDIIPVNSDQNTLCKYEKDKCYFLFKFSTIDKVKNLYLHVFQDKISSFEIYAKEVYESDIYNKSKLPNEENYKFTSKHQLNKNHLLIDLIDLETKYLIISVKSDHPGVIVLISSLYTFVENINISPSAYQLYYLFKDNEITLKFPKNYNSYIANFVSIDGNGVVSLNNTDNEYYLKGNSDNLGIIISYYTSNQIIVKAIDKDFGFYINYEIRNNINFDEIEFGNSGVIYYEESSFPLIYYSKIPKDYTDINVIINIKNYSKRNIPENEILLSENDTTIEDLSFKIHGCLVDKNLIIKKKNDPDINPNQDIFFKGQFDPSLKIAKIEFTKEKIKKFKKDEAYLYVIIRKGEDSKLYNLITSEYSIFPQSSNLYIAPHNQYIFANIKKGNNQNNIYKLRISNENDRVIQIEFSSNKNNNVGIAVMKNPPKNNNFINETKIEYLGLKNGKNYFLINLNKTKEDEENLIEVYFIVFSLNSNPLNYVFKYSSAINNDYLPIYSIKESKVNYDIKNDTNNNIIVKLTLNTISKKINNENIKISTTYIAKVVEKFEVNNDFGSISFGTGKPIKTYKKIYKGSDSLINMTLYDFPKEKNNYIVISAITNEDSNEIFYYDLIKNPLNGIIETDKEKEKEKEKKKEKEKEKEKDRKSKGLNNFSAAIIILIIILIGFILILGIWFYKMRLDNKELRLKINQLSQYQLDKDEDENLNYVTINSQY